MKSIKPGRGPSQRGAAGAAIAIVWGVIWTIAAASMTAGMGGFGLIFPLFGLCFIGMGVYNLIYHKRNAEADPEDRDSLLEIVDTQSELSGDATQSAAYCPWCGEKLAEDYQYCPKCGRKLP